MIKNIISKLFWLIIIIVGGGVAVMLVAGVAALFVFSNSCSSDQKELKNITKPAIEQFTALKPHPNAIYGDVMITEGGDCVDSKPRTEAKKSATVTDTYANSVATIDTYMTQKGFTKTRSFDTYGCSDGLEESYQYKREDLAVDIDIKDISARPVGYCDTFNPTTSQSALDITMNYSKSL